MASGIRYAFRPKGAQRKEDTTPKKGIRRYLFELKEGNKQFWLSGHAVTKLITLGCIITALDYFESMLPHPVLVLVLSMEVAIYIFFIFLNTFAINRYITFIFWPMTDLLNSLFSCVFLAGSVFFAFKARRTLPKPYLTAMVITVASMTFFIMAQAHEPYIVITGLEVTIILFLIALYMCRLDKMVR